MTFTCLLATITLAATALAVSPPPDGGYPMENTAEGEDALLNLNVSVGYSNTAVGFEALYQDTTGADNVATGASALFSNTTGFGNTATGHLTLFTNATGMHNTATGANALSNTTGNDNTGTGYMALSGTYNSDTGINNTADGFQALYSVSSGSNNTAIGFEALSTDTDGSNNAASGANALYSNTTGADNTASGYYALYSNTTGSENTATGNSALMGNTGGNSNTASGFQALNANTMGQQNTANGQTALLRNTIGGNNTAEGFQALYFNTSGFNNIALGAAAGRNLTTGSFNIEIGNEGVAGESNNIRIGTKGTHKNTVIAGISGVVVPSGVGVIINPQGKLGTVVSSARYKDAIKPMDQASEAILALKPVTFRYKKELDPQAIRQFGLVAEEVEKVDPDLVARDEEGKPYTVRYEAVNAMLLNEFLKEHRKVETLELVLTEQQNESQTSAAEQQREIDSLKIALKEQAAQIQKVSDRFEANKSSPPVVSNNE